MVRTGRVQAPLQHVAVDHHSAVQVSVAASLLDRADVNDERPGRQLASQVLRAYPVQTRPGSGEQNIDRAHRTSVHRPSFPAALPTGAKSARRTELPTQCLRAGVLVQFSRLVTDSPARAHSG